MKIFLLFSLTAFFISMTYYLFKIYILVVELNKKLKEEKTITRDDLNRDIDEWLRSFPRDKV